MPNVLTGLIPTIYESLDVVLRELVGFIPAVARNSSAARAALNEPVRIPITRAETAYDIAPAVTSPDNGDNTVDYLDMTISRSRGVPVRFSGEDQVGLNNSGVYNDIFGKRLQQAMRVLVNQIENDLVNVAYQNASRAYGVAGTAPLGTSGDLSDIAQVRKILDDNGAPQSDLHLVLGSSAVANMRGKQGLLLKVNEAGSSALLRQGSISDLPVEGFELHNSSAIKQIIKGTGASYVTSGSTAVGVNSIALVTGSGTVNPGDIATFAADANNKYVVNTGVAAPGTITIGKPGALVTIATANALTVGNNYTPNMAFYRDAVQLITRAPARPKEGDNAIDVMIVQDPISGLAFEISVYPQYRQVRYEVAMAWGYQVIKPELVATLIG